MDDGKLDALGQTIVSALPGVATGHSVAFNQLTVTVSWLNATAWALAALTSPLTIVCPRASSLPSSIA